MSLTFDYTKELETGKYPFICHEKDSTLYNYYIEGEQALDTHTRSNYGDYTGIAFSNVDRHLTSKSVSRIGVKNFPGIGGIGFYLDAYSDDSRIVAPIHPESTKYEAPTLLTAEIANSKLHIVIQKPASMSYDCYRIIARQGPFAAEYITYKLECWVEPPTVKGTYTVKCIGYDEATSSISDESNALSLSVENGNDNWIPVVDSVNDLAAELHLTEATLTARLDDQEERLEFVEEHVGNNISFSLDESGTGLSIDVTSILKPFAEYKIRTTSTGNYDASISITVNDVTTQYLYTKCGQIMLIDDAFTLDYGVTQGLCWTIISQSDKVYVDGTQAPPNTKINSWMYNTNVDFVIEVKQ